MDGEGSIVEERNLLGGGKGFCTFLPSPMNTVECRVVFPLFEVVFLERKGCVGPKNLAKMGQ